MKKVTLTEAHIEKIVKKILNEQITDVELDKMIDDLAEGGNDLMKLAQYLSSNPNRSNFINLLLQKNKSL